MERRWTNHLGQCDCGAEVYAHFEGPECIEQTAECKCGAPVCQGCQEARERVCEECGAHVCDASAIDFHEYWVCLGCVRRQHSAETAEIYQELA